MLSDRCPLCLSVLSVCLSVTFVHCGQTVGWMKMKLGMRVGLCTGHTVLDRDPAPPLTKGHSPSPPFLAHIYGWMDQDVTWYGGRPRPRRLCVGWGLRSPSPNGERSSPQIFNHVHCGQNGWIDQDDTWHGGKPQHRRLCVRMGPSPFPKKGAEPPPQFSVHFYCGQTAECIKMPLVMETDLRPRDFV